MLADPAQAFLDQSIAVLRNALNHQVTAYNEEREQRLANLVADSQWKKLDAVKQQGLLKKQSLGAPATAKTATADELTETLDEVSLSAWEDRRKALAHRFDELRMEAAKLLEPRIVRVHLSHSTVHDEAELEAWLDEAKAVVLDKLKDGPVML